MTMMAVATVAILAAMAMLLTRAFRGPTVLDRALAVNSFGTKTVLLIGVLNFLTGRPEFLDLALVYALMNFIATIAVLRFSRYGRLAVGHEDEEAEAAEVAEAVASGKVE